MRYMCECKQTYWMWNQTHVLKHWATVNNQFVLPVGWERNRSCRLTVTVPELLGDHLDERSVEKQHGVSLDFLWDNYTHTEYCFHMVKSNNGCFCCLCNVPNIWPQKWAVKRWRERGGAACLKRLPACRLQQCGEERRLGGGTSPGDGRLTGVWALTWPKPHWALSSNVKNKQKRGYFND